MAHLFFGRCEGEVIPHDVSITLGTRESGIALTLTLKSWDPMDEDRFIRPALRLFCWGPYDRMMDRFELLGNLIRVRANTKNTCSNGWGMRIF